MTMWPIPSVSCALHRLRSRVARCLALLVVPANHTMQSQWLAKKNCTDHSHSAPTRVHRGPTIQIQQKERLQNGLTPGLPAIRELSKYFRRSRYFGRAL